MAVIAIIIVLIGLVLMVAKDAQTRALVNRARAEIKQMEVGLDAYKLDNNVFPSSLSTNSLGKYMNFTANQLSGALIIDPFGTNYVYRAAGTSNVGSFDLASNGPDRAPDTADDIANWKF